MIVILSFVLVIALRWAPRLAPRCPLEISDGRSRPTSWERLRGHQRRNVVATATNATSDIPIPAFDSEEKGAHFLSGLSVRGNLFLFSS